MKKQFRIQLHNDMKSRANELLSLLDSVNPGEIPKDSFASLKCRDVETAARFLAEAFETEE